MMPKQNVSRIMLPMRRIQSKEDSSGLRTFETKVQSSSRESLFKRSPYNRKTFCNHQPGSDMPIILNVFSLCNASDIKSEEPRRKLHQEYNLPVITPPCSPSLDLGASSIISEKHGSCYGSGTCLPSNLPNSSKGVTFNSTTPNNFLVDNDCAQNFGFKYRNQPPKLQLQSHKKHTLNYLPDNAEYSTNVVNGNFTTNDEGAVICGQNNFVHSDKCLCKKRRLMYNDRNGCAPKRGQCASKGEMSAKRQYVITKLVQHIERNKYLKR